MFIGALSYISQNIGILTAILSATIAWIALKANHDWNRRNYALQLVGEWNAKTSMHRKAIENAFPGLIDKDNRSGTCTEITKQIAQEIYKSRPEEANWQVRFHLIELGNHLEFISTAYLHSVGDKEILEQAFRAPLIRWHDIMANFIAEVEVHRKYKPWEPWDRAVNHWKSKPVLKRPETA
jgi:hypothetical protein